MRSLTSMSLRMRTVAVIAGLVLSCWPGTQPAPAARAETGVAGKTVVLDPGHAGGNDGNLSRQVSNGRGGTKDCQTTGTSTDGGYPEHSFNWDVVQRIDAELRALGVHTVLTRSDDTSPGPCVDARAATANAAHPDAIVSIHADGAPAGGHGFHVNYSAPPLNDAQSGPAVQLATTMRDALAGAGLAESTYLGSNGLYGRSDLAGLNLADYPAVLVELGNMRNPGDAAAMTSADGRARYAEAVTSGIVAYLQRGATG